MREWMNISTPILLATLHSLPIHCHIPMLTQTRSAQSLPSLGGGGGVIAHNAKQSDLPRPFLPPHPPPSVSSSQLLPLLGLICMGWSKIQGRFDHMSIQLVDIALFCACFLHFRMSGWFCYMAARRSESGREEKRTHTIPLRTLT